MIRSLIMSAVCAAFACGVSARSPAPAYIVTVVPVAQPGDGCIAEGVSSGQETKTPDGSNVLVRGVHGADTRRCTHPGFPNLASTQKLAPDEVRDKPSVQCIPPGSRVGDEVVVPFYGRAVVLDLHAVNPQCGRPGLPDLVEATVIGAAAHRAAKAVQVQTAPGDSSTPAAAGAREPTDAEIRQEYDRLFAAAAPLEEFHVRHILLRTREEAMSALDRIKSGQPFAGIASEVSVDPGARVNGGDLGWAVPSHFVAEFSNAMISLKPTGLLQQPVRTRFGWHVIEVLAVQWGKQSFPSYEQVRERVALKLKQDSDRLLAAPRVKIAAVCRRMVAPEAALASPGDSGAVTVEAEMRIENGKVAAITRLSGPAAFHAAVTKAVNQYGCDRFDRPVMVIQSFSFKSVD